MSDNIEFTPEARWRHLRDHGPRLLVNLTSHDAINEKPVWFDEERFARAKAAVEKFYIGVAYSSLTGLLLILQLPDGLEPLLVTGNSKDIPSLYKRYLSTILHVNTWYEDDIFNPDTKGYKSIRQVRSMHKRVQQLMNEKHQVRDLHGQEHKWMTQYDVALTQFSFIGLAMLFPAKSAMIAATSEHLELINYYWRVLGFMMGIEDTFNACQFDKYDDIKEFMRLIFEREFKAKFEQHECKKGLEMTKSICLALQYFTPLVTFNSLAHWWQDCFTFNGYKLEPMTVKDKVLLTWTNFSFNTLLKSERFLKYSNKLHKRRFEQRLKKKDVVYEQLKDQYKDCPHLTYYSDRIDYFNKNSATPTTGAQDANNNNGSEAAPVSMKHKMPPSAIAVTTFKGCPMGYDAVLPALHPPQQQQQSDTSAPA